MTKDEIEDRVDIIRSAIYADDRQTSREINTAIAALGSLVIEILHNKATIDLTELYLRDDKAMRDQDRRCKRILRGHVKPGCKCRYCKAVSLVITNLSATLPCIHSDFIDLADGSATCRGCGLVKEGIEA